MRAPSRIWPTCWRRRRAGYHLSGRETHGHSMIVDPWGVVLDRLPRGSGVVIAGVNPTYQAAVCARACRR